jgi:predicted secreted protein
MMSRTLVAAIFDFGISAAASAAPEPPPVVAGDRPDPSEVVCEKVEVTGSRLAVRRVCMTRSQWADRTAQDREATERMQIKRGVAADD